MREPAQGVDSVGLFSVICYVLYLKHDALAQQLCGFVSCSSQGIDQMQCEYHGSWHSQKSDMFLTISRTHFLLFLCWWRMALCVCVCSMR